MITKHIWDQRYEDINAFEQYLTRNGVVIRKFFLHISKEEQKRRFLERLEYPQEHEPRRRCSRGILNHSS